MAAEQRDRRAPRSPVAAIEVLRNWLEAGLSPGLAAVIARDGRVLGELYAGQSDGEEAVLPETLFPLSTLSTIFTSCAALALVEDGLRALDEPLGDLLTEVAAEDRPHLTLRRLLTHATGFPADLGEEELERIGPTPTLEQMIGQYGRIRPISPPGSQVRYSVINANLLALVIERLTAESFVSFVQRRVFDPIGLAQTTYAPEASASPAIARISGAERAGEPTEEFNSSWWRALRLPGNGAFASARDLARFLSACLAEQPPEGFLSATTLELMTRSQSADLSGGNPLLLTWPRAEWGFGFEVRSEKRLHPFGELTSAETFGQLGPSGVMAWADPDSGLVCVLLTNHAMAPDLARRVPLLCRFSNAVIAALAE